MNLGTRKLRIKFHCLVGLIIVALITVASYLTDKNGCIMHEQEPQKKHLLARKEERKKGKEEQTTNEEEGIAVNDTTVSSCNLFSGRWVFDNVSYPLYEEGQCSFMLNVFNDFGCQKYGRKDVKYQKWGWQPHDCDLPRFNGRELLEKIRGKRLVFVGDSLSRNQWTSMLCLIESSLHQSSPKSVIRNGNLFIFQATEYNATIEFYWSPLLVESNCDDPFNHSHKVERIIRIKAIEKHARHWTDADILIFNAYMWWVDPTMILLWGSFGSSNAIYKSVKMKLRRYEMTLNTLSDWLEININRTKTKLFFISETPQHFFGESWRTEQNCYNETEPVLKEGYWGISTDREMMHIAESVIQKLETRGLNVEYLNITNLSDYRKDGHPSIYNKLANLKSYADCTHWCLPGVPDVWNEILYSYIINS